jgi:hypothetical protein
MKLKIKQSQFDELLIESKLELGLLGEDSSVDMSQRELLALKAQAIKEGTVDFFKNFKITPDQIQLKPGNKAIISDGTGLSYIIEFEVHAWNPPTINIKKLSQIEVESLDNPEPEQI